MSKVIEVNFKNKKHIKCCDTLLRTLGELEDMQLSLIDMQKEISEVKNRHGLDSDMDERLSKKIADISEKHQKMQIRAEMSGCFDDEVTSHVKKKCNTEECDTE